MTPERQTAIGAFVLGGIVLGLAAILLFGNLRIFSPVTNATIIFQDSISGLSVGAPVTFRGVRVGSVANISLKFSNETNTAYIPVKIELGPGSVQILEDKGSKAPSLEELITRGLRAELNTQSFVTGQANINLNFDPAAPAIFHPGVSDLTEIPTRQSAIQRVTEQLSEVHLTELTDNANTTLVSLRTLSAKLSSDLPPLIESLKTSSDKSGQAIDIASRAIVDVQARMDATMTHVDRLTTDGDHELRTRSADLRDLLASSQQTVEKAGSMMTNLDSLTAQHGETRANLDATLRDLAATTASLQGFASDIEHNPQLLLTGRKP